MPVQVTIVVEAGANPMTGARQRASCAVGHVAATPAECTRTSAIRDQDLP